MSKEEIYDEQINPLMAQIIEICKDNKIAFLANFRLEEDLVCTSAVLEPDCDPSPQQLEAFDILYKREPVFAFAETIETKPDGTKHITIRPL